LALAITNLLLAIDFSPIHFGDCGGLGGGGAELKYKKKIF
jgi:hypothetical protein